MGIIIENQNQSSCRESDPENGQFQLFSDRAITPVTELDHFQSH